MLSIVDSVVIAERIKLALDANNMSIRRMCRTESEYKKVQRQLRGNYAIALDTIVLLLETIPKLSADWLFRGVGDMMIGLNATPSNQVNLDQYENNNSGVQTIDSNAQASTTESALVQVLREQVTYQQSIIDKLLFAK